MSKILKMIALAIICTAFTACNDDATENDANLSQTLLGRWQIIFTSDNTANEIIYTFNDINFTYYTKSIDAQQQSKSVTIKGTWNIYKGVLQLKYDLGSLATTGLSEAEQAVLRNNFQSDNKLLEDLNESGTPYGPVITFGTQGGTDTMRLSTVNGTFTRAY